jgi:hypothetical protein
MSRQIKFIYLDQYNLEFRLGYDTACVVNAIKDSLKFYFESNQIKTVYINIHKENLSSCQGLCAENLFYSEVVKEPPNISKEQKVENEIWLMIKPSKMITH